MYNNPYMPYGRQNFDERIDSQIAQLQQMKEQFKQQPSINQTFQLAPNTTSMKYANTIDDVMKEVVYGDTPIFSKDMTVMWIKNVKNEIKTYEINEIVPKDEKDIKIEYLLAQIEQLKKGNKNEPVNDVDESITNADESEKSSIISTISKSSKKSKQS